MLQTFCILRSFVLVQIAYRQKIGYKATFECNPETTLWLIQCNFPNCGMPSILYHHQETSNIAFFLASDLRNAARDPAFFETQSLNVNGSDCSK